MAPINCALCNIQILSNEDSLRCDECSRWQHRLCQKNMSQAKYRRLTKTHSSWHCGDCDPTPARHVTKPSRRVLTSIQADSRPLHAGRPTPVRCGDKKWLSLDFIPEGFLPRDLRVGEQQHVLMASAEQLTYLSKATTWYMGGVNKLHGSTLGLQPFYRLFGIHCYVRKGERLKQIPACFVFMSKSEATADLRKKDYTVVLEAVLGVLPSPLAVTEVVADFDKALWDAVREVIPAAPIHGCFSKWTFDVSRNIAKCHLSGAYRDDPVVRNYIQQIMALPNLPSTHILAAFLQLCAYPPLPVGGSGVTKNLNAFLQYMNTTWMSDTTFPPASWCVFRRHIRTNCGIRGFYSYLAKDPTDVHLTEACRTHPYPEFYQLVHSLHTQAAVMLGYNMTMMSAGWSGLPKPRDKEHKVALEDLWEQYSRQGRTLTTTNYLNKCVAVWNRKRELASKKTPLVEF